jgi:hypothetical protein
VSLTAAEIRLQLNNWIAAVPGQPLQRVAN